MISPRTFAPDGAWCWFGEPTALDIDGKVTLCWVTRNGDAQIGQYDRATRDFTVYDLAYDTPPDDHSVPSIIQKPDDGRLMVFWTQHSVSGVPLNYAISTNANDITAWGPTQSLPTQLAGQTRYCYPNPIWNPSDHRLYLFWRAGILPGPQAVSWTTDWGSTWEPAHELIENPGQRPYTRYVYKPDSGGIGIVTTDGNPNEVSDNSVYYVELAHDSNDDGRLHFRKASGTWTGRLADGPLPVSPLKMDLIHDGSTLPLGWHWDLAYDADDNPVVLGAMFNSSSDHHGRYISYSPTSPHWTNNEIAALGPSIADPTREPYYSPGLVLDRNDPTHFYVSAMTTDGNRELFDYTTTDRGATYTVEQLTSASGRDNLRPIQPRVAAVDAPAGLMWMAGTYHHWAGDYNTAVVGIPDPAETRTVARMSCTVTPDSVPAHASPIVACLLVDDADDTVLPDKPVALWCRPVDGTWEHLDDGTTDASGQASWTRHPTSSAYYEVRFAGDDDTVAAVSARTKVTLTA